MLTKNIFHYYRPKQKKYETKKKLYKNNDKFLYTNKLYLQGTPISTRVGK